MGLNTRHDKSSNKATNGLNITRGCKFSYKVLPNTECRKIEMSQNLAFNQVKMAIEISGKANVALFDKVKVLDRQFKVVSVNWVADNDELFRHRTDIENFTGRTTIGLE